MLDVYGSLLYAGSEPCRYSCPTRRTRSGQQCVRMRGRTHLGATFFQVIDEYSTRLEQHHGRLFLSGVDPALLEQFTRAGGRAADRITALSATDVVGESSLAAYARATAWVISG